jgi:predicted HTH domain antitoxin
MTTESDHENYLLLTAKLFESGSLTMSQAAKKCGCNIYEFIALLYKYNISVINYPASDLESDVKNARESLKNFKQ